jgi:hypothetical protein
MPKVTNAFTTYLAKGNREDLYETIFNIEPSDTPFLSMSETRSISNVMFDWQTEKLPAKNPTNAQVEGFVLTRSAATPTTRIGNVAQISERDATVSGTQEAADAAGKSGEMAHQMALNGKALKRDMETILLGPQPYNAGADDVTARNTRGLEHWITTNAFYGATGANPVSATAPITPGTPRAFTEAMLGDAMQQTYDNGGEPDKLLMGSYIKRVFSTFVGRHDSRRTVDTDEVVASVDFYVSDFGEVKAYPCRNITKSTVIGWDKDYSKTAYYRKLERIDIGTIGDATTKLMVSEYGLQCSNEAAHFKIADLITSGPITIPSLMTTDARVIGGVMGTPAAGDPPPDNAMGRMRTVDPRGGISQQFDGSTTGATLSKEGEIVGSPGGFAPVPFGGLNPGDLPPPPPEARAAQPPATDKGTTPGLLSLATGANPSEAVAKAPKETKGSVVWGDGSSDSKASHTGAKHTYETPGDYSVRLVDEHGLLLDSQTFHVPI